LLFKDIYKQYKQQNPKSQTEFYETHRREITLYKAAKSYLDGVMIGKTSLPTKIWRAEREKLTAEKNQLNREYIMLKEEVREIEKIRSSVYDILSAERNRKQPIRTQDMDI
jgi:hypothetical protein